MAPQSRQRTRSVARGMQAPRTQPDADVRAPASTLIRIIARAPARPAGFGLPESEPAVCYPPCSGPPRDWRAEYGGAQPALDEEGRRGLRADPRARRLAPHPP